jgi:hypothetical protein
VLHLQNRELRLDILDPAADRERLGSRYCWGGYIWQVHDLTRGPLVSGPEFPKPDPGWFNGQGLPESFRHRTRDGAPLTWSGETGLAVGIGTIAAGEKNTTAIIEPCSWNISRQPDHLVFQTRQSAAGFSYELTRKIELNGRSVGSFSQLTNVGDQALTLQWFAHPFWPLTGGRARIQLPPGTTVPTNPGFSIATDGTLTFRRAFVGEQDNQFALLTLPPGVELSARFAHPVISGVTFTASFVPNECPVWANAHTVSVEPYLDLRIAPGHSEHWHVQHGFEL